MCVNNFCQCIILLCLCLFLFGCGSMRIVVKNINGQNISGAIVVVREISMFKPAKIQTASFYKTDTKGEVCVNKLSTFNLSCGKVGYWASSTYTIDRSGEYVIILHEAEKQNFKNADYVVNTDDLKKHELWNDWKNYLQWQREHIKKLDLK